MTIAITRQPPLSLVKCITSTDQVPNAEMARDQWMKYTEALEKGCSKVIRMPAMENYPDSVFVEDTVVCVGNRALLCNVGHVSRRGEGASVKIELEKLGIKVSLMNSEDGGTLDGGDVLHTGPHLFVGMSKRTNIQGFQALKKHFAVDGIETFAIDIPEQTLHLKCLVTQLKDNHLVVYDSEMGRKVFQKIQELSADGKGRDQRYCAVFVPEMVSANVVTLPDKNLVLVQNKCQKSVDIIKKYLFDNFTNERWEIVELEMSELIKADGCLTCQSVLVSPSTF